MNLTRGQMIVLGIAIVFGLPITIGLVAGHFFGFWSGALIGGAVFAIIVAIGQRHMRRLR